MTNKQTTVQPDPAPAVTQTQEQEPEWVLATSFRMMPSDTNPDGNIYGGGRPCDHIDTAACIAAYEVHSGKVATRRMEIDFLAPICVGDILKGFYLIDKVGTTSIKVKVKLEAWRRQPATEDGIEEVMILAATATVIYVALTNEGKKTEVDKKGTNRNW